MTTTTRLRRWTQAATGAALVALGLWGLALTWQGLATAQPTDPGRSHEAMHQMMDAMHGEGTAARMHEIEGAEQMMDQCAAMMDMMGGMDRSGMREMMGRPGHGRHDGPHDGATLTGERRPR